MRRVEIYKAFKKGQHRILVATDLVGRGIDIERVNIVINYDMPVGGTPETTNLTEGADTYLHRVSPVTASGSGQRSEGLRFEPGHRLIVRPKSVFISKHAGS